MIPPDSGYGLDTDDLRRGAQLMNQAAGSEEQACGVLRLGRMEPDPTTGESPFGSTPEAGAVESAWVDAVDARIADAKYLAELTRLLADHLEQTADAYDGVDVDKQHGFDRLRLDHETSNGDRDGR